MNLTNQLQPPAGPRSRRILVVDDDAPVCKCVRSLLENLDDQVFEAHNATAALKLVSRLDFNAIVSDVSLPDGSGFELLTTV